MKIILLILVGALAIWPVVCWFSYHTIGWKFWEKIFKRPITNHDTMIASSVGLRKFGNYNRCIHVGIDDYGVSFVPSKILLFHTAFAVPWINILSYEIIIARSSKRCVLNTNVGKLTLVGEVAEIVARGCEHHYVTLVPTGV